MVFGDGGKQNESMVFQCFPRLTPVAPVPSDVLKSSFFFQQYHYCKLHSRSCCKCRSCQVDEVVKIGSFNTLNEGVPFPVPALVTGEGDRGGFSNTSMVFREGESFFKHETKGDIPRLQ